MKENHSEASILPITCIRRKPAGGQSCLCGWVAPEYKIRTKKWKPHSPACMSHKVLPLFKELAHCCVSSPFFFLSTLGDRSWETLSDCRVAPPPQAGGKSGRSSWICYPDASVLGCLTARHSTSSECLTDTNKWTDGVDVLNQMFSVSHDAMSLKTRRATSEGM